MLKRRSERKLIVLLDELTFLSGLRLFLLVAFSPVSSVHYLSLRRYGAMWVGIVRRLAWCSDITEFTPDPTSQMPEGGAIWDWLHVSVQTDAEAVVDRLLADRVLSSLVAGVSPPRQKAFWRKKVQLEIYRPLMLLLHARQSESWLSEGTQLVLLVNLSDLAPLLRSVLHDSLPGSAGLRLIGYADVKSLLLVRIVRFLIEQMRNLTQRLYENCLVRRKKKYPKTVAVQCAHGLDGPLFHTNDLWWYSRSGLRSDQCLVLFNHPRFPATDEIINDLEQKGYRYRILRPRANATSGSIVDGFPSQSFARTFADLALLTRLILKAPRLVAPCWQISRGLATRMHLRRWQRLMEAENIGVLFSVEQTSLDVMSLAADLAGAIRIGFHWSMLQPSNARLIPLHQVYFVWGSNSQAIVTERSGGCSEVVLQSGCIFDDKDARLNLQDNALQLRARFQSAGVKHIIGVLDRSLGRTSYYPMSRHLQFYESLVTWAESDAKIGLLIKSKHYEGPRVCAFAPQLASRIQALVSDGRAVLLDGRRPVIEADLASDVIVALGYNSGGMVAALNGARTVFWDPTEPHAGPLGSWFRKIGWDNPDVVFSTLDRLVESVQLFLEQPSALPGLGDLSPLLNEIDSFRDGDSALRIGSFVRWFLEGLDGDLNRTGALQLAIGNYQCEWGTEKAFCHTPYAPDEFRKVTSMGGK